jgi:hypothetical protein
MNSRRCLFCLTALLVVALADGEVIAAPAWSKPTPQRRAEIERSLVIGPWAWGASAGERSIWADVATQLPTVELLAAAERARAEPAAELTEELYRRFSRDGNRDEYQEANRQRLGRLTLFAWAEALQGEGRFIAPLRVEIDRQLAERTWVLPAHDRKLDNLEGRATEVDLMAAMKGWVLGTILLWHGEAFGPEVRQHIQAELRRRVIDPYLHAAREGPSTPGMWWLRTGNNWNSVCHAGVIGTALTGVATLAESAEIIACAELNLRYYLEGFTADGYCSEGVGYWNYGFGHFVMLAETVAQATGGKVQLMEGERAARAAAYPWGLQILPGVFPAYADMNVKDRPLPWFGALATRQQARAAQGMAPVPLRVGDLRSQMLYESAMKVFLPGLTRGLPLARPPQSAGLRHWFDEAQVYVGRVNDQFGAAIKGGHNAEHHNHNDVGSFVVALRDRAVLVDPGLEIYTARTFGARRYESSVLNSFGHAVPKVAGRLQSTGRAFAGRVLSTRFSDAEDIIVLDLRGAYEVPGLTRLERTFILRRSPQAEVIVRDNVAFAQPERFESPLIVFEPWQRASEALIHVGQDRSRVRVEITGSQAWTLQPATIVEDLPGKRRPERLAVALSEAAREAQIEFRITPEAAGVQGR